MGATMNDTIVTVRFTDLAGARRALRMLRLLSSEGQLRVRAAALVERSAQGAAVARGATLVVAEIEDPDPDVLASALDALGGTATREPAEALCAELGAAGRR